ANAIVRASNILMLALGNVGRSGGGCNIYRGHDNVPGATDVGPNPDTLPGYYPVAVPGSWAHWARVWNVDLEWLKKQYASEAMMAKPGDRKSRRVGKEWRSRCDWISDVCSSDLVAVPGSWAHWARVWNVDLEWLKKQYASEAMMAKP